MGSNILCPICEGHVWTYAPGKSYTVYNGENYHPKCLSEVLGVDAETATPVEDVTAPTAGAENEPLHNAEDTTAPRI